MPDTDSIVIVKEFQYRGQSEEFSNRYHLDTPAASNEAEWLAMANGIIALERTIMPAQVKFVRAYAYKAGTEHSIYQFDFTVPPLTVVSGNFSAAGGVNTGGDVAATIRWDTGELNSRGKRIYCRKYFHSVFATSGDGDTLLPAQGTAMATFATNMINGSLPGSGKYVGPQGAQLSSPLVSPWLTTRTLKRRGKRPLP